MEGELGQMGVEFDDDGQVSNVVILGMWLLVIRECGCLGIANGKAR